MADEHIISLDLDDPRAEVVAEVMANKTCRKILALLSSREMNQSEIAAELGLGLNTLDYNIKKLLETGLIEKATTHFWSVKGRKVEHYRIAHKQIVITPRKIGFSVIPVILIMAILSGFIYTGFGFMSSSTKSAAIGTYDNSYLQTASQESFENGSASQVNKTGALAEQVSAAHVNALARNEQRVIYQPLIDGGMISLWFFVGALVALFIFTLWNWRKLR